MAGISPGDCVAPAFNLMQKRLFQPFRFGYWSRIAVLGVLTGELSTSGNGGGGQHTSAAYGNPATGHGFDPTWIAQHWNLILSVIGAIFVLAILFFYVGSVLRFVLYEAVLRDKANIHDGFARWRDQGFEYFSFRLMLVIPYVALAVYLIGLPLLKVLKAGGGGPEIVTAVAQLAGAVLFVLLVGLLLLIVMVLTKDFVVPQMMFERVTCTEGWGRLLSRIKAEPINYAGYILLKIVLAIAALMAFIILMVILAVIVAIPAAIAVAAGVVAFKAAAGNILAIGIAIALASVIAVPVIVYCVGFAGAPITVFFPAYSIYFFASRYKPLYDELYRQPLPSQAS
jgi:hypothetical protein